MYTIVITNTVRQGCSEQYKEVSKRFMNEMSQLPGCLRAEVWQDRDDECQILNVITWQTEEASKADNGSLFLKYKAELKPYFVTNTTKTYSL